MEQKVSVATDQTGNQGGSGIPVLNCSHIVPSPICVEFCVPMNHIPPLNGAIGKHGLAVNVLHKGQPVVQQFHDCGYLITHVSPVGDHAIAPFQSSRVVIFGAGLVKIEGAAVGFAIFKDPSTPMLTCGTYPLPVGEAHDSSLNSVIVGMDPEWDHQCGWDHIRLILFRSFLGQVKEGAELIATAGAGSLAAVAEKLGSNMLEGLAKQFIGQFVGDATGSRDIGRRYQERMQRRRAAGDRFRSARGQEAARGVLEGAGEVLAGPIEGLAVGPASDDLFGTGPEEPEL